MSVEDAPVLLVGEALIDAIVPTDGGAARRVPGGSVANVAITLARLGRHARLLTSTGEDDDGAAVRKWLTSSGVELAVGSDGAGRTSVARAELGADGQATYDFEITWDLPPDDLVHRAATGAHHVHVGSIGAILAPGAASVLRLIRHVRAGAATVSYDPNVRPAIMGDAVCTRAQVEEIVALSDVVKVSDEDLAWLAPGEDILAVAQQWATLGPGVVVVTTGAKGCFAVGGAGTLRVPGVPTTVVDTVGAGDTFMGALIDGLVTTGALGRPIRGNRAALSEHVLRDVLERCTYAASITVSRSGANPPTHHDLRTLAGHGERPRTFVAGETEHA